MVFHGPSLAGPEGWRPATLFLTHFGPSEQPVPHLAELRDHLDQFERLATDIISSEADDTAREAAFISRVRQRLRSRMIDDDLRAYEVAGRFDLNFRGLARYVSNLRKAG